MKRNVNTQKMVICALFSALCAIGAFIQIPVPYFDYFTLQFLIVLLAGLLLGSNLGAFAIALYVLIGLLGLPVFASGGGAGYIVQPSFGYLLGFIACAWVTGKIKEVVHKISIAYVLAVIGGLLVTYIIGLSYKYMILNVYTGEIISWKILLLSCFPLDLPGDVILASIGAVLGYRLDKLSVFQKF